jgi:hypothetical protein
MELRVCSHDVVLRELNYYYYYLIGGQMDFHPAPVVQQ